MLPVIVFGVIVTLIVASLIRGAKTITKTTAPMLGGCVSVVIPLQEVSEDAKSMVVDLFRKAAHPLRVHVYLGVNDGEKAPLFEALRDSLSKHNLHVSTTNVHILETDHVAHITGSETNGMSDCVRARLSNGLLGVPGVIVHLCQPQGGVKLPYQWDTVMEGEAMRSPGCIITSPFTDSPAFTAMRRSFHDDTSLPQSAVFSAAKPMEMPASIFSPVYAFGTSLSFVPFDLHLCCAPASSDVVYSARLWVHGARLVHPLKCHINYTPLSGTIGVEGAVDCCSRMLCQMGVITLPNTTPEARDLPGQPLTPTQRDAWANSVGVYFNTSTVTIRGTYGITTGCGNLVVFNKTQRL